MRFIHCADLHLDSPLRGLERYAGAPALEMREATRRAFINLIDLSLERQVDCVLIAGDIFDGDWPDFNTGLFFADQLRRLGDAQIRVFIVRGNHDALNKISRSISLPPNVHVFKANKPSTVIDERLGLAVHGQSYGTGALSDDLAAHYPQAHVGLLNIGMLHTALAGRAGHASYAPTSAERLSAKGYQYWALGHVHTREIVSQSPWIVFPGNTQGRHAREVGAKGCMLVQGSADAGIESVEFLATDVARWQQLSVDITEMLSMDELQGAVQQSVRAAVRDAQARLLALRLTISGRSALHGHLVGRLQNLRAQLCAWLNEATAGTAWLEKVELRVSAPLDLVALAARDDPFGILLRRLDELAADPQALAQLAAVALSELDQKIPPELRESEALLQPLSAQLTAQALASARERLLAAISLEEAP